jgi:hypothetical protein
MNLLVIAFCKFKLINTYKIIVAVLIRERYPYCIGSSKRESSGREINKKPLTNTSPRA